MIFPFKYSGLFGWNAKQSDDMEFQVPISKLFERKIVIIFLPISLNTCFGCSKEPSY